MERSRFWLWRCRGTNACAGTEAESRPANTVSPANRRSIPPLNAASIASAAHGTAPGTWENSRALTGFLAGFELIALTSRESSRPAEFPCGIGHDHSSAPCLSNASGGAGWPAGGWLIALAPVEPSRRRRPIQGFALSALSGAEILVGVRRLFSTGACWAKGGDLTHWSADPLLRQRVAPRPSRSDPAKLEGSSGKGLMRSSLLVQTEKAIRHRAGKDIPQDRGHHVLPLMQVCEHGG